MSSTKWLIFLVIILDQLTKFFARIFLNNPLTIIPKFLSLHFVKNSGVVFGFFQDSNLLMIFISLVIIISLVYYLWKVQYNLWLSLVAVAAVSNLVDRVFFGYVTDFIAFSFWPVFNVADAVISLSVVWLFYLEFRKINVS